MGGTVDPYWQPNSWEPFSLAFPWQTLLAWETLSIYINSRSKSLTLQSESFPLIPVTPLAGTSDFSSTRRITVPSQVGKVKDRGGPSQGFARHETLNNSFSVPPMEL